jgi:enoyl-CoA hydratase/carnithine racemase
MSVNLTFEAGRALLTLERPEVLNAMDTTAYREITEALEEIERNPQARVAIVSGAGDRAFSAGADLKEMHGNEGGAAWRAWQPDRWDFGARTSKPMVAAVRGYALAGGLELALLCDIRIASEDAVFGCPEVKWNLLHGYGALRLPALVGLSNAMSMLLTGESIDAAEALRIGLVSAVVPAEELMDRAWETSGLILRNADEAVMMTKELALQGLGRPLEDGLRLYRELYRRLEASSEQQQRLGTFGRDGGPASVAGPEA